MRRRLVPLLALLIVLALGCNLFAQTTAPVSTLVSTGVAGTLTALASVSASEQSGDPTGTPETPTPEDGIVLTPGIGVPALSTPIPQPSGQKVLILLGSDQRPIGASYRTDVMLVIVLKPDGSINLISFPRDLWVYLPGKFMQRINTAQEYGGFNLLKATFQYNFGFSPESYVMTNFNGFQSIIDGLGGIDVSVSQTFHDVRDGYYPDGYTVPAGLVHMNGSTALWYVRSRQSSSDYDRLRRAQEVVIAIGRKLVSLNGLARVPELYNGFRGAVVTDLTVQDVIDLLPALQKIDPAKIHQFMIGPAQVVPSITSGGADVLMPNYNSIHQLLEQALGSP